MEQFKDILRFALQQYLLEKKEIDGRMPECPDVEDRWRSIAEAYLPDGVREFNKYPLASLGWMMYVGMAVAKMWDADWEKYSAVENLYTFMRDKRGYDNMDEYIREEVLQLRGADYEALDKLVGNCASNVCNLLRHQQIEPGTKAAYVAYVDCLHQLYLFGAAVQLKRMGYHMTKVG